MKYFKKYGWMLEYKPRYFQEQISEIIGKQKQRGYWKCPNCESKKNNKNIKRM